VHDDSWIIPGCYCKLLWLKCYRSQVYSKDLIRFPNTWELQCIFSHYTVSGKMSWKTYSYNRSHSKWRNGSSYLLDCQDSFKKWTHFRNEEEVQIWSQKPHLLLPIWETQGLQVCPMRQSICERHVYVAQMSSVLIPPKTSKPHFSESLILSFFLPLGL
jgi:hypothetical protein